MKAFWKRRYLSRDLEKIRQKSLQGQGRGGGKERNCESFGEGWGRAGDGVGGDLVPGLEDPGMFKKLIPGETDVCVPR